MLDNMRHCKRTDIFLDKRNRKKYLSKDNTWDKCKSTANKLKQNKNN